VYRLELPEREREGGGDAWHMTGRGVFGRSVISAAVQSVYYTEPVIIS